MTSQPPESPSHHADDHDAPDTDDLESAPEEIIAKAGDETDVPHPVNWRILTAEDAEYEWLALNEWVDWLRHEFGLPASVVPPYWHRHPELVWELSALHLHWLGAYHPDQHASAPIGWMTDFRAAQARLREWVALSGTRLDRDRPTRQTPWPGEDPQAATAEAPITNRDEDFVACVIADVNRRADAEAAFLSSGESGDEDLP